MCRDYQHKLLTTTICDGATIHVDYWERPFFPLNKCIVSAFDICLVIDDVTITGEGLQDLRSALTAISSDSKPSCIKFLWCPVSSKPVIESLSEEHNDLGLTQSGFESPPPAHKANALYHCATTTVWQFFYIIFYYFSMSKRLTEKHALEVEKKIVCCFSISYL